MNKFKSSRLEVKIISLMGAIIFFIIFLYTIIFSRHYEEYEESVIGEENISTLHSMEASINTMIKSADDYSKMMIADSIIQTQMESGNLFTNVSEQYEVMNRIYSVMQFSDVVDSVWLIDNQGQKLTVRCTANISYEYQEEKEEEDYKELQKPYGKSQILTMRKGSKDNKLSLVRSYNSLNNFKSVGIIGIDIKNEIFQNLISGIINLEEEMVVLIDQKGNIIYQGGVCPENVLIQQEAEKLDGKQKEILENCTFDGNSYMVAGVKTNKYNWKILRYTPLERNRDASEIVRFNLILIIVIGLMILVGAATISGMLTRPIWQLLVCMKDVEEGKLTRIDKKVYLEEFKSLFKGYNHMVSQIERLIQETIDRQRRIRQVEMNEIQEQMKPHFLYNTLDSIEALALMGDTEKVCKLVEALGDFYRKSVSGGREFLTVKEEFKMAEDYADIMKIRFGDTFSCRIFLDEECNNYKIPKLTIQPLVENAFQHGIRAKKQFGEIYVKGSILDHKLIVLIRDNGEGIPDEIVDELAQNKEPTTGKSLGLRGTIERLRLVYGEAFEYEIQNQTDSEIQLSITLSALEERENG